MSSSIVIRGAVALAFVVLWDKPIFAQTGALSPVRAILQHLPPPEFRVLYASFVTMQILDVHSTRRAIGTRGAREWNPILAPVAGSALALLAVKSAVAVFSVRRLERLRHRDSRRAKIVTIALTAAQAAIVVRNYRTGFHR